MRKGYRPSLLTNAAGQLVAIATGSDATAEHEGGSRPLMESLCKEQPLYAREVADLIRAKQLAKVPDILSPRRITENLSGLVWHEDTVKVTDEAGTHEQPSAMLAYSARPLEALRMQDSPELHMPNFAHPRDISGAWDEFGFAIRVMGADKVAQLREFYQAMLAKQCLFAGLFIRDDGASSMTGVIICNEQHLTDDHRAAMKAAQSDFEENVQLYLDSRVNELNIACKERAWFGHVSPHYQKDDQGNKVLRYSLNPAFGVKAKYGSYSFEQLMPWVAAGPNSGLTLQRS